MVDEYTVHKYFAERNGLWERNLGGKQCMSYFMEL